MATQKSGSVDTELEIEGVTRLKLCVSGVDPVTGTASADSYRLGLYAFRVSDTVEPVFETILQLDEVARLYDFVGAVSLVRDRSAAVSGRLLELSEPGPDALLAEILRHPQFLSNPDLVRRVVDAEPELTRTIIESDFTAAEIKGLAYRRRQLEVMRSLLDDPAAFESYRSSNSLESAEGVWQHFFEQNTWVFGLGLDLVFGEGALQGKLERTVSGYSIAEPGKRVDALLRSRGAIKSLCYVEIKRHDTRLLHETEYRSGIYRPSTELSGGVSQVQGTVQKAIETLGSSFSPRLGTADDALLMNIQPRSVLVCGSLTEFVSGSVCETDRFVSFELFRRNLQAPEVVTFDELYERARAVVEPSLSD